jgi:NADH dehydrogenase (ubiquinone) 1 alpha subcomplex subunit 9
VRHSDIVYNLVGRDYETKYVLQNRPLMPLTNPYRNFSYSAVHTEGAEVIASVCRRVGVPRLVHVSHLNAAHDSLSEFYRVKARGEEHVMDVFPNATIVRPGPMFGHEDKLLNSMAGMCSLHVCLLCF